MINWLSLPWHQTKTDNSVVPTTASTAAVTAERGEQVAGGETLHTMPVSTEVKVLARLLTHDRQPRPIRAVAVDNAFAGGSGFRKATVRTGGKI